MVKAKNNTANNGKEVKVQKGKNIRFSEESHKRLIEYCKKRGYNLGAFCEMGALQRMETEE